MPHKLQQELNVHGSRPQMTFTNTPQRTGVRRTRIGPERGQRQLGTNFCCFVVCSGHSGDLVSIIFHYSLITLERLILALPSNDRWAGKGPRPNDRGFDPESTKF